MIEIDDLFFQLIQVALGRRALLERSLSEDEWGMLFTMAQKQAIAGVTLEAIEVLRKNNQKPPMQVLFEWIALSEQVKNHNTLVTERCWELERFFKKNGFKCCVLKGQGTALYYKNPEYRQSGDIDMCVSKDGIRGKDDIRKNILACLKKNGINVGHVDIKHTDADFFEDVPVEIHFLPSWLYSPLNNKRLQRFFDDGAEIQYRNYDSKARFTHTTIEFDLVFSLVHIYRHVFEEGVGLRQLLDYYNIVLFSDKKQRDEAAVVLNRLGMKRFVGGVMWVMHRCFGLEQEFFLCDMNERHGKFLLSEIMMAGNFGHYDTRYHFQVKDKRFHNGMIYLKRNMRNLRYYPSEVLWAPVWKVWHWSWRKWKGYL